MDHTPAVPPKGNQVDLKQQMEKIYGEMPLQKIPWNLETPPPILVELVESGTVAPCTAADLGCGGGNYAVWLAGKGFQVTGIDLAPSAVELARQLAKDKEVSAQFKALDLTRPDAELPDPFEFVFDWEVLHHVFPAERPQYVQNVFRMLQPGGKYLSVCFSEDDDADFGGEGKYRTTPLNTTLYFSSTAELRELFEPLFVLHELDTVVVPGKHRSHVAVKAFMSRRD